MELLERDDQRAALESALRDSRTAGRVVVVGGEAGIGKTSLVSAVSRAPGAGRVLWGACDPLVTPRPLGPFWDVGHDGAGDLLALLEAGASREDVLAEVLGELTAGDGAALVIEDLHWADEATLDLVALLARRLGRARGCLVLTCRTDPLSLRPDLRRVLGALPPDRTERVTLAPLTEAAVAVLRERAGRDAHDLHAITGGNPFFVTEALSAPEGGGVPGSVRDAMAQRLAALDDAARAVAELAAVVPGAAELWLLQDAAGASAEALDACAGAGILVLSGGAMRFRHELARRAVEDEIAPVRRRALDRAVLRALEAHGGADPARLAHHARRAEDAGAIRRLAPVAARAASAASSHREAHQHWEAALAAGGDGTEAALAGVAVEAYLCGETERALEARGTLLERHQAANDDLATGDDLRWMCRLLWWLGRGPEAEAAGERAVDVLERLPASRELAMALSTRSQLAMLADRNDEAIALGRRAVGLGRRLGDDEIVAHAMINVGTARMAKDYERGRRQIEEAHVLAARAGLDDHAARALVNLAVVATVRRRNDPRGPADMTRALAFAQEHDLDGYAQYLLGVRAVQRLQHGEWDAAEADARASLALGEHVGVSVHPAQVTLARLHVRRGAPEASAAVEEVVRAARATGELQRLAPALTTLAEHRWLEGDDAGAADAVRDTYLLAVERGDPWTLGEVALWMWRSGALDGVPAAPVAEPYGRSIAGDARGAAAAWSALGQRYEAADAMVDDDGEPDARLAALAVLDDLGATRVAALLRLRLRRAGVLRIPRGPRRTTRQSPAGLTTREVEVLGLLADGATNAEIAAKLVISPRTAGHHVSAVLGKLGVRSRRDAAAAASRLRDGTHGAPGGPR